MEMTGEQFVHIINLFLTLVNTCGILWIVMFIFSDPEEDIDKDKKDKE